MIRPWNFSAGPSVLPEEVLRQAASEMLDWNGSGMSVMEMSHRGKQFTSIRNQAEADLRSLLNIPEEFAVLFMQGGATAQNAILPLNLLGSGRSNKADYLITGNWSVKSYKEAKKYGDISVAATCEGNATINGSHQEPWTWYPTPEQWNVRPDSSYVHICSNETISGLEFVDWPDMAELGAANVALVVDASSHLLSRPIDFSKVDVVYAGAQKNAGPAGLTIVIIRRSLLGVGSETCPSVFSYSAVDKADSMLNTPPTYAIYMAGLVFKWLINQGGIQVIEKHNIEKASLLYNYLDQTEFYTNKVAPAFRSRMNIPFHLQDNSLEQAFLEQAEHDGLLQLKGHKSVGGMRASIYNAMPLEGVKALVSFMQGFEQRYG